MMSWYVRLLNHGTYGYRVYHGKREILNGVMVRKVPEDMRVRRIPNDIMVRKVP